jgi:orc1/cdc6 family replication initiation protein
MYQENMIIKDLRVLTERFIPGRIVHREGQLHAVRDNLKPITESRKPRNSFLFGEPGTGKTCISLYVAEELKKHIPVFSSYLNCWQYSSRFRILLKVLQDLGLSLSVHRKGTPTDELLDMLANKTREKPGLVILDEIDQLEDEKVLYDLLEMGGICMIFIANSGTVFYSVDPRIRSRLSGMDNIEFPPYTTREIFDILKDRAEWGLVPNTIKNIQLERIADFSGGDARTAIETLRVAAEGAENDDSERISDKHIEAGMKSVGDLSQNRAAEKLNSHQKLLYNIIRKKGEIRPADLYCQYYSLCKKDPANERTVRKHLEKMARYGLIRSAGSGRWRVYRC